MDVGWADKEGPWNKTDGNRSAGLQIVLLKCTHVFPWSQFLHAEGTDEEVQVAFSTHDVVIRGQQLGSLLADLSAQRVILLREPGRGERFTSRAGPRITVIAVQKVE